jgi:hypothetical protein
MALLIKEMKAFTEANTAAAKAVSPQDKLIFGLAGINAARKFFDKLGPTLTEKIKQERDRYLRDWNEKELRSQEPDYPNGVDYPNPPGNSGPDPDGGSAVA